MLVSSPPPDHPRMSSEPDASPLCSWPADADADADADAGVEGSLTDPHREALGPIKLGGPPPTLVLLLILPSSCTP